MKFTDFGLHPELVAATEQEGYMSPTPIQEAVIPLILSGKDVVGGAPTGTGKTAGFLLPIFHRMYERRWLPFELLVLSPTRELALQIGDHAQRLSGHRVNPALLYGGVPIKKQLRQLQRKPPVVVATPGRLLDHIGRGTVSFRSLNVLVLDEADRMLDMGFLPDIERILRKLPTKRQTLLFSATIGDDVRRLVSRLSHDPVFVDVREDADAPTRIEQLVFPVSYQKKLDLLVELLRRRPPSSALIFCQTKRWADVLFEVLGRHGIEVGVLHADRTQQERERTLRDFREGKLRVLVASDLASRGLDIETISHVINFDMPETPDVYTQRIGRTAHSPDGVGVAWTLATPYDTVFLRQIEQKLGVELPRETLEGFDDPQLPDYFRRGHSRPVFASASRRGRRGGFARRRVRAR